MNVLTPSLSNVASLEHEHHPLAKVEKVWQQEPIAASIILREEAREEGKGATVPPEPPNFPEPGASRVRC